MKRLLVGFAIAVPSAFLVASVYSPSAAQYTFWEQHELARGIISYLGFPTVYLLSLLGIDLTTSATPRVWATFLQWMIAGYLIGGIFFREKGPDSIRASRP